MRLNGKIALITGGGAGIGAATAATFRKEGAQVFVVDKDGGDFVADVADPKTAALAVAQVVKQFGRLDILVNNAAMRNYSAVADATPEEWRSVLDVNLGGAAGFCRAAIPELRKAGKGAIVNVSSCYGVASRKGMAIYDATKAGLISLTRTLAHEESAHGIRANAVCPGSTYTDFHRKRGLKLDARDDNSLMGRWASPEEIAWPILWLASGEASFITGTTLMVDGGLHIF